MWHSKGIFFTDYFTSNLLNNAFLIAKIIVSEGTSLVAQWLRIRLPMQGTWVWTLVREDPTCCRAIKPVHHNYWAWALKPMSHNYWSPWATTTETHVPQLLKPMCHNYWSLCTQNPCPATREAPAMRSPHTATKSSPRSRQLEKARAQQRRPNRAKKKKKRSLNC